MKKIFKVIIPSLLMILLIYIWRDGKDILNGLFVAFPLMYIILGIMSCDRKELLISLFLLSVAFLIPINLWFHMGSCIEYVVIFSIVSFISYLIKNKVKTKFKK